MKKYLFCLIAFTLVANVAHAQTQQATANSKYGWDQDAVDLATANALTYSAYVDTLAPTTISAVTCTGTISPFQCLGTITPGLTPGTHTVTLTASNFAGESLKSSPLSFVFVVVPNPPRNLKIVGK